MPRKQSSIDSILAPLKQLSHIHGGNYFVHYGMTDQAPRGYWLLYESMYHLPGGTLFRSSQIHHSWAMSLQLSRHPMEMRKLPYFSLSYLLKGKGRYVDARHPKGIALSAGDLICMFPDQEHVYAPDPGTRWDEINVNFTGEVFHGWVGQNMLDPKVSIRRLEPVSHWLEKIHEIVLPLAKPGRNPTVTDTGKFIALISQMCQAWQTPWEDADVRWLEAAQHHLRAWPLDQPLDLRQLAKHFAVTQQTYRKKFKRLSGMTPTNYHARLIIEQACQRLQHAQIPLKQIADELGFGSEYYFSRRFKQIAGMPPGAYRKKVVSG
ncbi:MAG: AraC family transcriptional regulator [Phycisphaeraceae bacterium]|nr:AraC family transcriptional regulator [Phycisphaeraceae bacterium]